MKLSGLLAILGGVFLIGGNGFLASLVSFIRHALRVFT
jgi:hypothetical protein